MELPDFCLLSTAPVFVCTRVAYASLFHTPHTPHVWSINPNYGYSSRNDINLPPHPVIRQKSKNFAELQKFFYLDDDMEAVKKAMSDAGVLSVAVGDCFNWWLNYATVRIIQRPD